MRRWTMKFDASNTFFTVMGKNMTIQYIYCHIMDIFAPYIAIFSFLAVYTVVLYPPLQVCDYGRQEEVHIFDKYNYPKGKVLELQHI